MAGGLYLLRFFRIVSPMPPLMTMAFAGATAVACGVVFMRPDRAGAAATPLLMLQLFASASGFAVPARRGHFDLPLTIGFSRVRIASVHWLMSILPGAGSWLILALAELAATGGMQASLLASGTLAAVMYVSTIPWAVTVALPRFGGAIGWLLVLAMAGMVAPESQALFAGLDGRASWVWPAMAATIYPPLLVGQGVGGAQVLHVLPGFVICATSMAVALAWVHVHDIPLEAAQ